MIKFDKLLKIMADRKISIYKLKTDKVIGTATLDEIRKGAGNIDTRSIDNLCRYLSVQPGDIMEYVED